MKYWCYYRSAENIKKEKFLIDKEEARKYLSTTYDPEFIDTIIDEGKSFQLYTPYRVIYTEDNGLVPMPGFYGICG